MLHSVESDMEDDEEKEGERGGGGGQVGGGNQGVYEIEMDREESGVAPRLKRCLQFRQGKQEWYDYMSRFVVESHLQGIPAINSTLLLTSSSERSLYYWR